MCSARAAAAAVAAALRIDFMRPRTRRLFTLAATIAARENRIARRARSMYIHICMYIYIYIYIYRYHRRHAPAHVFE